MSANVEVSLPAPSANGELIHRVQQLRLDDQLGRGTGPSRGSWLPWVLCGMMAIAWAGIGARWYRTADAPVAADSSGSASARPAGSSGGPGQTAAKGELLLQLKGTLIPFLQINLSPDDVAGTVTEIYFKEGDLVKKGQILATIRNVRYLNDYNAAQATMENARFRLEEMWPKNVRKIEIDQAQAEWAEAEANRVRAEKDLERLKDKGVVSAQEIDKAQAELDSAKARVKRLALTKQILEEGPRKEKFKAAEYELESAKARFEECKRLLENCTIRAPSDGTILTKVADPGVLVSPTSFNVASGVCSMADLSDLEAEIDVREDQIAQVRPGLECRLTPVADPNREYRGRVDRIMPIADDTKNTIKVRVKVQLPPGEAPGAFLKPKMSTAVRVYNTEIPPFHAATKTATADLPDDLKTFTW